MRTPTKLRPRTKPPGERRDELMNAALRLFLKQGVATTTIEQITSGAEVAKGTFYLYFSSKEDLLAALGDRFGKKLLEGIKAAIDKMPKNDWKGKLSAWARAAVTVYLDSIREHDVVFYGSRPAKREGLVDNIIVDHLFELLEAGIAVGAWTVEEPRVTAVFLFTGLHGAVDASQTNGKRINRTQLADIVEQLCLRSVGPTID